MTIEEQMAAHVGQAERPNSQVADQLTQLTVVVQEIEGDVTALEKRLDAVLRERNSQPDDKIETLAMVQVPLASALGGTVDRLAAVKGQLASVLARLEL